MTGVIFLELEGLKADHDGLSDQVGDEVLTIVAERMKNEIRDADILGRCGHDEFLVHVSTGTRIEILAIADRLVDVGTKPVQLDGHRFHVSMSAGLALVRRGETVEEAIGRATEHCRRRTGSLAAA